MDIFFFGKYSKGCVFNRVFVIFVINLFMWVRWYMKDMKNGGNVKCGKKFVWYYWDILEKNMVFKLVFVW